MGSWQPPIPQTDAPPASPNSHRHPSSFESHPQRPPKAFEQFHPTRPPPARQSLVRFFLPTSRISAPRPRSPAPAPRAHPSIRRSTSAPQNPPPQSISLKNFAKLFPHYSGASIQDRASL